MTETTVTETKPKMNFDEFVLSEPIKGHDGEIRVLTLKKATMRMVAKLGFPFKIGQNAALEPEFQTDVMLKWASELTGLDDIILMQMSAFDALELFILIHYKIVLHPRARQ
jgi:hypothetical protein